MCLRLVSDRANEWQHNREATVDTAPQSSLSDILRSADDGGRLPERANKGALRDTHAVFAAEAEWRAAIAALGQMLVSLPRPTSTVETPSSHEGIVLSGPLPVLNKAELGTRLETWVATPQPLAEALNGQRSLLPSSGYPTASIPQPAFQALPLTLQNPLLKERFCLVATPAFSVGLVLGQPLGDSPCLQYSFDPQVLLALWQQVRSHVVETVLESVDRLDERLTASMGTPDYRLITRFTQRLLARLPHRFSDTALTLEERNGVRFAHWAHSARESVPQAKPALHVAREHPLPNKPSSLRSDCLDTELLQAMAHEIRTPLTTIRTLVRSLLRRQDLAADVKKRLARVDEECTQQIDRFNLIFRAVELETMESDRPRSSLTPIALTQIFQNAIPRWQQQAHRRNLSLDVALPPDLPRVTSDPTLLNEVLTGVVEWFTQCLPPQSHIQMSVTLAGHQLKLQFEAESTAMACSVNGDGNNHRQPLKSLGQLLMVAPETGGLSLNLDATKNLFEFLGGKLIVRQRPQQGEVLTVFLPLDAREV